MGSVRGKPQGGGLLWAELLNRGSIRASIRDQEPAVDLLLDVDREVPKLEAECSNKLVSQSDEAWACSISSASTIAVWRTSARLPEKMRRSTRAAPFLRATLRKTSPTGLCGVPPPGPAIPVTDTAISPRRAPPRPVPLLPRSAR